MAVVAIRQITMKTEMRRQAGRRFLGVRVCRAIHFVARKVRLYQSCSSRFHHGRDIDEDVKDKAEDAETDDTQHNLCWARVAGVVVVMGNNRHCAVGRRWGFGSGQDRLVCCRVWRMGTMAGMLGGLHSWLSVYVIDMVEECNKHLLLHPLPSAFLPLHEKLKTADSLMIGVGWVDV